MSRCFGEYLAEMAGEGYDLDAPVPHRRRAGRFVAVRDIITLADAAADGAPGDPATSQATAAELHETKTASANPFPRPAAPGLSCAVGSATRRRDGALS